MIIFLAFCFGLFAMEAVAWASHKWLMHGPLWILHQSHHVDRKGKFEANDLFGVFFSLLAIVLIGLGVSGSPILLGLGLGMTGYGLGYFFIHDTLTHGRLGRIEMPKSNYLRRLVRAHRIHHSRDAKDGTRNFGFLWVVNGNGDDVRNGHLEKIH